MDRSPPPSARRRRPRRDRRSIDGHAAVAEATAPGRPCRSEARFLFGTLGMSHEDDGRRQGRRGATRAP
eukprot:scaffold201143_cov34-Tisochrysis_lutea.AAC.3